MIIVALAFVILTIAGLSLTFYLFVKAFNDPELFILMLMALSMTITCGWATQQALIS